VAEVGYFIQCNAEFGTEFFANCALVRNALKEVVDVQFLCPSAHHFGGFAGEDAHRNAQHSAPEYAGTVVGVEFLQFVSPLVVVHAPVGPNAVYVGEHQFDLFHSTTKYDCMAENRLRLMAISSRGKTSFSA